MRSASSSRAAGPLGGAAGDSAGERRRNPSSTGAAAASAAIQPAISSSELSRARWAPKSNAAGSISSGRGWLVAVEVEAEAGLEGRGAGPAQALHRQVLAGDGALHEQQQVRAGDLDRPAGRAHAQRLAVEAAAERRLRLGRRAHRRFVEGPGGDAFGGQPLPIRRGIGGGGGALEVVSAAPGPLLRLVERDAEGRGQPRRIDSVERHHDEDPLGQRGSREPGRGWGGLLPRLGSPVPVSTEATSAPQYTHCRRAIATGR